MYADAAFFDAPAWHGEPRRRLRVALILATACVLLLAAQLQMPNATPQPLNALIVNVVTPDPVVKAEQPPIVAPAVIPPKPAVPDVATASQPATDVAAEPQQRLDLDSLIREAVVARTDAPNYALNPAFERKRAAAAERFAPIDRRDRRPVWENVEKDHTGRTILRSGDCWRVLDDPNVGNREQFEVFGQYLTKCAFYKRKPQLLPWVDEVNARQARPQEGGRQAAE